MIKYDISAGELLKIFDKDYEPKNAKKAIKQFEDKNKLILPSCLREFLEAALCHPFLETADIWVREKDIEYCFWYDIIQEILDSKAEDFENGDDEGEFSDFLHNPREKWGEFVPDYLVLGSDYGAGVVFFGIKIDDMTKENPPVYFNHEANPVTQWNQVHKTLSDYLLTTVCDAVLGEYYDTALWIMMEDGWKCKTYSDTYEDDDIELVVFEQLMKEYGIETEKLHKMDSEWADWIACCYNQEKHEVYLFVSEDSQMEVRIYSKAE